MIEKYRALITAVELGSVTRASEALGCTQSAVSHAIGSLERELGFRLLRRARGMGGRPGPPAAEPREAPHRLGGDGAADGRCRLRDVCGHAAAPDRRRDGRLAL